MASTSTSGAQLSRHPLPPALDKLLADLAASSESNPHSLKELPNLWDRKAYGNLFEPSWSGEVVDMEDERRWQVRLQLLTAIGKCPTLESIFLLGSYEIGVRRVEEVDALLGGLTQFNTVLKELTIYGSAAPGLVSEVSCRGPLGSLLSRTRTLQALRLRDANVEAAGLGHLVQALLTNPNSVPLRDLDLSGNRMAALLQDNALPSLLSLNILGIGLGCGRRAFHIPALATNSTLKSLGLGCMRPTRGMNLFGPLRQRMNLLGLRLDLLGSWVDWMRNIKSTAWSSCDEMALVPQSGLDGIIISLRTNDVLEGRLLASLVLDIGQAALSMVEALFELRIQKLSLLGLRASKSVKRAIFLALGRNSTLVDLNMSGWEDLDDELYENLIWTPFKSISHCKRLS